MNRRNYTLSSTRNDNIKLVFNLIFKNKIFPTQEVPVKDVSGAGDTFLAGLVFEYVKSGNINKAIKFAQICTTKVVQKHGVSTV